MSRKGAQRNLRFHGIPRKIEESQQRLPDADVGEIDRRKEPDDHVGEPLDEISRADPEGGSKGFIG